MTARPPAPVLSPAEAARLSRPAVDIAADEREEAAARALAEVDGVLWNSLSEKIGTCEHYRRLARAALAAVRPPAPAEGDANARRLAWFTDAELEAECARRRGAPADDPAAAVCEDCEHPCGPAGCCCPDACPAVQTDGRPR